MVELAKAPLMGYILTWLSYQRLHDDTFEDEVRIKECQVSEEDRPMSKPESGGIRSGIGRFTSVSREDEGQLVLRGILGLNDLSQRMRAERVVAGWQPSTGGQGVIHPNKHRRPS